MVMNKLLQVHQNKLCIKLVKIVLSNLSCKKFEPCHFKKIEHPWRRALSWMFYYTIMLIYW